MPARTRELKAHMVQEYSRWPQELCFFKEEKQDGREGKNGF